MRVLKTKIMEYYEIILNQDDSNLYEKIINFCKEKIGECKFELSIAPNWGMPTCTYRIKKK